MYTASLLTPVPGGVGPMTVTMLLENTVQGFVTQKEQESRKTYGDCRRCLSFRFE